MGYLLTAIICAYLGYKSGWINAHLMVAKECERLGSFFVGKKVYKCVEVTDESKT